MTEALLISNALLWVVVVILAAVIAALVRQVGVLHERVAPAGALIGREGPQVGAPAPLLTLSDWAGRRVTIGGADPEQKCTLLAFVSPTCPVCKTMLGILESVLRSERDWLRVVLASDGPREEHESFVRAHRLAERTYVLSRELGFAFQVGKLPYGVLIDAAGTLRAKGLINTREHVESLFEAHRQQVASVQEYLRRREA